MTLDNETPILEVKALGKGFNGNMVLKNLNFSLKRGEIIGLIGLNGSGKSTLMKILSQQPLIDETGGYEGEIFFENRKLGRNLKEEYRKLCDSIGFIQQELLLIEELKVYENIKINRENINSFGLVDVKKDKEDSRRILNKLGVNLNAESCLSNTSITSRQFVEIARELNKKNLKLLMLDEPTSSINKVDSQKILDLILKLKEEGLTMILASHRLDEILKVSDRIMVLRDGELMGVHRRDEVNLKFLAEELTGDNVEKSVKTPLIKTESNDEILFKLENYSVEGKDEKVEGINLSISKGEMFGVTSLSNHGRLALGYGIFGLFKSSGKVIWKGKPLNISDTEETLKKGIFLLPDDRKKLGLIQDKSISYNICFTPYIIKNLFSKKILGIKFIDRKKTEDISRAFIEELEIVCEGPLQNVIELSGGNQQKVCLARAFALKPELLVVMDPTRGIDIKAKKYILQALRKLNDEGTTIIYITSELEELKSLCSRIMVLYEGKVSKILTSENSDRDFALAMSFLGGKDEL